MNYRETILRDILPSVTNPAQYVGTEKNTVVKDPAGVDLSVALAFPDVYEIGMSHLGLQILYHVVNADDAFLAERVYAPLPDYAERLAQADIPLVTLETGRPVADFDVVGFSLQHELCYTTVLWMLELAGIPMRSADRSDAHPIVVAGGPCAFCPEPMASFIDVFFLGDGEESFPEFLHKVSDLKRAGASRSEILRECAVSIQGVYVPSLYEPRYNDDGTIESIEAREGAPVPVVARAVADLENAPYPTRPIVPLARTVHDRIMIEIMRGCPHACRFCQAGATRRPVRLRSQERVLELAEESYKNTGHSEIALLSLSSSDYPEILDLARRIGERFSARHVNLSLPSLRVGKELRQLPAVLANVRRGGFTVAPEAASDYLRSIANKRICEADLQDGLRDAYAAGWKVVKLYFMIGLPGERDEDVERISELCGRLSRLRKEVASGAAQINATVSSFIPKAMTAFQWAKMISLDEVRRKQNLILAHRRRGPVKFKFHEPEQSFIEGVFARGDRRLGDALLAARVLGVKLDSWRENFSFDLWLKAFDDAKVDPSWYAERERDPQEILPWSHLSAGVSRERLRKEYERAMEATAQRGQADQQDA